jgi:hypothetical protein
MDNKLKKSVLQEVYNYLKEKGYKDFKAKLLSIENPKKIVEKQSGNTYEPDMTASLDNSSYLFEVEMGENMKIDKEKFIKKCKAFQNYAETKNGKLYLIVPIEQFDKIMAEVNKNNLENIGILQLQIG